MKLFRKKTRQLLARILLVTMVVVNCLSNTAFVAAAAEHSWKHGYHNCLKNESCMEEMVEFFAEYAEEHEDFDEQAELTKEILRIAALFDEDPTEILDTYIDGDIYEYVKSLNWAEKATASDAQKATASDARKATDSNAEKATDSDAETATASNWPDLKKLVKNEKPKYQDSYCCAIENDLEPEVMLEDSTFSVTAGDSAEITITGLLPEDGWITAEPVKVELDDKIVLGAYDISIWDADGNEFQPVEDSVTVSVTFPEAENLEIETVEVYHLSELTATASNAAKISDADLTEDTLIDSVEILDSTVEFDAESFSVYVFTATEVESPDFEVGKGKKYETIAAAVAAAQNGDHIIFADDMTESVVVGKNKELTFDLQGYNWTGDNGIALTAESKVTVQSIGSDEDRGTMKGADGFLAIKANAGLTIDQMNLEGAGTVKTSGGIVYVKGELVVKNSVFKNGDTTWSGGAIYHANSAAVTITDTTFENNKAQYGAGAVYTSSESKVLLKNDIFRKNTAMGSYAGAVYLYNSKSSLYMEGCEFYENSTHGYGGALYTSGEMELQDSIFENNYAEQSGGAVCCYSSFRITKCKFIGNTANVGSGGAVYSSPASSTFVGTFELKDNQYEENSAASSATNTSGRGGAVNISSKNSTVTFENEKAYGNKAKDGGAYYLYAKTISMKNGAITHNDASNLGGGAFIQGISNGSTIKIDPASMKIFGNTAPADNGKASELHIRVTSDKASYSTVYSALSTVKSKTLWNGTTLKAYKADESDKLIGSEFADEFGKYVLGATVLQNATAKSGSYYYGYFRLGYSSTVTPPSVIYLDAGAKHNHLPEVMQLSVSSAEEIISCTTIEEALQIAATEKKNKIYVCSTFELTQAEADLMNANAQSDSPVTWVRCNDNTSAMFRISGEVTLDGVHIDGNNVEAKSAMITLSAGRKLNITGNTVIEKGYNTTGDGGAISLSQASLNMTGGEIRYNAAKKGGGIYSYSCTSDSKMTIDGGVISNNNASDYGGGLYIGYGTVEIGCNPDSNGESPIFKNNTASMGGGAYITGKKDHKIYAARFENNEATRPGEYYDGGGLYVDKNTTCYMKNVFVKNNKTLSTGVPGCAIAACPSGQLAVYEINGAYVADNGTPDIGVISGGISYKHTAYVSDIALGGGDNNFTKGRSVEKAPKSYYQYTDGYFSVMAHPSDQTEELARDNATVFFTGNKCQQYGSAIMTNGTLIIGTKTKSLKVNKEWTDGNAEHGDDEVNIWLQYSNDKGNTWKNVDLETRKDAKQVLNASNNWTAVWSKLGESQMWRAVEANVAGYTGIVGDPQKSDEFAAIEADLYTQTITNEQGGNPGRLTIQKKASGLTDANGYEFTLSLENLENSYFLPYQIEGINGTETVETQFIEVNDDKSAKITFTLNADEKLSITGLPVGTEYSVEESSGDYSTFVDDGNKTMETRSAQGTITEDESEVIIKYLNIATGSLSISKTVESAGNEVDREFTFTMSLKDAEADYMNAITASSYAADGTQTEIELVPKDGVYTFGLRGGDGISFSLPEGLSYEIKEKEDSLFTTTVETKAFAGEADADALPEAVDTGVTAKGTIGSEGSIITVAYENTLKTGELAVSKKVSGNKGDTERIWHFDLKLNTPEGIALPNPLAYEGSGTLTKSTTADLYEITLVHGQSIRIKNLPEGTTYSVTEAESNQDGYTTTVTGAEGTIKSKETAAADFVNKKDVPETPPTTPPGGGGHSGGGGGGGSHDDGSDPVPPTTVITEGEVPLAKMPGESSENPILEIFESMVPLARTGDDSKSVLYLALMFISLVGLGIGSMKLRKKREE